MNVPTGPEDTRRGKWLSALSVVVGIFVGVSIGSTVFLFLYILALPVGLLVGGILGYLWGRRNPITTTGFAALGVLLAEAVFVWGELSLPLPTRSITWFMAPVVGVLGLWLSPLLAKRLWSEQQTRENMALFSATVFLFVPVGFSQLMPKDPIQADIDSFAVQTGFFTRCDALAEAEGHHKTRDFPPQPAAHLKLLRTFPELRCPGIVAPMKNREAGLGDWRIVMHFVTKAGFADTVNYYQKLLPGGTLQQKPVEGAFPCTRITGTLRGEPVSVIVADIPERGVGVAIF